MRNPTKYNIYYSATGAHTISLTRYITGTPCEIFFLHLPHYSPEGVTYPYSKYYVFNKELKESNYENCQFIDLSRQAILEYGNNRRPNNNFW